MSIQVSRSAFRRDGTTINMKPGVQTLKVGTIDVTGITIDTDYAIDVTSHLPVFKDNRSGEDTTKNFILDADIFDTGTTTLKTSILPSLAKILVSSSANSDTRIGTTVQQGDIDLQVDNKLAYIYNGTSWKHLAVTPLTFTVNVDTGKFRFTGKSIGTNLTWDGSNITEIRLFKGQTYTFDQSDNTNNNNPLYVSTNATGSSAVVSEYTSGVQHRIDDEDSTRAEYETGFDSYDDDKIYSMEFTVPNDAPNTLYLQSANTASMGAKLIIETAQDLTSISGDVVPSVDGTQDLGSSSKEWNDLFLDGAIKFTVSDANATSQSNSYHDRSLPAGYDYTELFRMLKASPSGNAGNWDGDAGDAFANLMTKKVIEANYYTQTASDNRYIQSGGTAGNLTLENASGGQLFIGDLSTTVASGNVLGKINFTSDDTNVGANNVHAYIEAKTNASITSAQHIGYTDLSFYTGNSSLAKSLQLGSDGVATFYYSPLVKQSAKPTFTSVTTDGGATYLTKESGTAVADVFPVDFANLVANTSDNDLYYIHRKADANLTVETVTSTYEIYEETNITGFIEGLQNLTTNSPDYAINVSQLKINGVVIDLDNISSNYDFWSDVQATTTISTTAGVKAITPTVVLPQVGTSLIPSDATLTNVTLLIKWRLTSNTSTAVNNIDTTTMKFQTKKGAGSFSDAYTFTDGSYHVPASTSASGDVLAINLNLSSSDLTSLQTSLGSGDVTYALQILGAKSVGDNLIFRDLSWGLRLYWR